MIVYKQLSRLVRDRPVDARLPRRNDRALRVSREVARCRRSSWNVERCSALFSPNLATLATGPGSDPQNRNPRVAAMPKMGFLSTSEPRGPYSGPLCRNPKDVRENRPEQGSPGTNFYRNPIFGTAATRGIRSWGSQPRPAAWRSGLSWGRKSRQVSAVVNSGVKGGSLFRPEGSDPLVTLELTTQADHPT